MCVRVSVFRGVLRPSVHILVAVDPPWMGRSDPLLWAMVASRVATGCLGVRFVTQSDYSLRSRFPGDCIVSSHSGCFELFPSYVWVSNPRCVMFRKLCLVAVPGHRLS